MGCDGNEPGFEAQLDYERGRQDAAQALADWSTEQRKGFVWIDKAIELALGPKERTPPAIE